MTGMSGTGKSTALAELAKRGFEVVETDDAPWSEWSEAEGGYVWREDLVAELLSRDDGATLYVSGTVSNQGRFYPLRRGGSLERAGRGAPAPYREPDGQRLRQGG